MTHEYPMNTKAGLLSAVAFAVMAGFLLGPLEAAAADYRHGTVNGRNVYGCEHQSDYRKVAKAFEQSKGEGEASLDQQIASGKCRMLPNKARVAITQTDTAYFATRVILSGETEGVWTDGNHIKHD